MGKVRNETIKKFARSIIEKYPNKFSRDYENNKKLLEEVADIQSKKLKNKIAGYVTTLISRTPSEPITEPTKESVIPPKEEKKPEKPVETTAEKKLKEEKPQAEPVEEEKEIKTEASKEEKLEKKEVEKPKEEKPKKPVKSAAEKKPEKVKPKKQAKVEK
ncbi:MAG: 30S ribosomal protein S17e [Candidatus Bathyarchaeota archaeon]|nr:30S ribosomal protein S17e [Candidatus Bathyarchaeota archaeon]